MKRFNKVAIIGVGLIGGSIGLAAKRRGVCREVIGVFRRRSTLNKALRYKAVDIGTLRVKDGVKDADLIILASPVRSIPGLAGEVIKYVKPGAIITDVGSTKKWIVGEIEKKMLRQKEAFFIGSHPMAGSEHASVEYAREDLLQGAPCIITKTQKTDRRALERVATFWKALGARVSIMSPARHDASVSAISHLPHIVAFSLAGAVPVKDLIYAAEGFKDTTRVASSDPELWADIFLTNKDEILKSCRMFERYYKKIINMLSGGDYAGVVRALSAAKAKRDKFAYGTKP